MLVWRSLENGRSFDEIVNEMIAAYDVDTEHAAASLKSLLLKLQSRKLVRPRI